jgi:hypothetical protein
MRRRWCVVPCASCSYITVTTLKSWFLALAECAKAQPPWGCPRSSRVSYEYIHICSSWCAWWIVPGTSCTVTTPQWCPRNTAGACNAPSSPCASFWRRPQDKEWLCSAFSLEYNGGSMLRRTCEPHCLFALCYQHLFWIASETSGSKLRCSNYLSNLFAWHPQAWI